MKNEYLVRVTVRFSRGVWQLTARSLSSNKPENTLMRGIVAAKGSRAKKFNRKKVSREKIVSN